MPGPQTSHQDLIIRSDDKWLSMKLLHGLAQLFEGEQDSSIRGDLIDFIEAVKVTISGLTDQGIFRISRARTGLNLVSSKRCS